MKRRIRWAVVSVAFVAALGMASLTQAAKVSILMLEFPELDKVWASFTERTGIELDVMIVPDWVQLQDKFMTMTAAGIPPDVVYGESQQTMPTFAALGMLRELDPLIRAHNIDMRRFPQVVLQEMRLQGKLYSLPSALSTRASIYNADLWAQNALEPPPADWKSNRYVWDEFVASMRKMTRDTNGDGRPDVFGQTAFGDWGGLNMLAMWNATDYDPKTNTFPGNSPAFIRAMEKMTALHTEYGVLGGNFLNGTSGTLMIQTYYLNTLMAEAQKGLQLNWKVGVTPKGDARITQASVHSLGISRSTKVPDAAMKLVEFLTSDPHGSVLFARSENRVPVTREATLDFISRWNRQFPGRHVDVFVTATEAISVPKIVAGAGGQERRDILNAAWLKVRDKKASVRQAYEEVTPAVNASLQAHMPFGLIGGN